MRFGKHGGGWLAGALSALLLGACGGSTDGRTTPAGDQTSPGSGSSSDPDPMKQGQPEAMTEAEIAAQIERIAGTSFNLPADPGSGCGYYYEQGPFMSDATYHFRKDDSGGLELVSSLATPWLRVDRSKVLPMPTRDGFRVESPPPTGGCMARAFEEEEMVAWPTPDSLLLAFSGMDEHAQPTALEVTAHFPETNDHSELVLTAAGSRDVLGPRLAEMGAYRRYGQGDDAFYISALNLPWRLPRSFFFSEPLAPGWSVAIENAAGDRFVLAEGANRSLVTSFEVAGYYPEGFRFSLSGQDFAGNPVQPGTDYPAQDLPQTDGEFESAFTMGRVCATSDGEIGRISEQQPCSSLSACLPELPPGPAEVPALVGNGSLALTCDGFLRLARKPNATSVAFDARYASGIVQSVTFGVMPLDTGSAVGFQPQAVVGEPLDAHPDGTSAVQRFTLPLPPGTDDVLVMIRGPQEANGELLDALWLDSLRTE